VHDNSESIKKLTSFLVQQMSNQSKTRIQREVKLSAAFVLILSAMFLTRVMRAEDMLPADSLQRHIPAFFAYKSFDEAIQQLEQKTGFKVSCPPDVATEMQALWSKKDFATTIQPGIADPETTVEELVGRISTDLCLSWRFDPKTGTIALDVPWRIVDPRHASELLKFAWKPGYNADLSKDQKWQDAFQALLCKELNFPKSLRVRQRSMFENMFRISNWGLQHTVAPLLIKQIIDASGKKYVFFLFVQPIQMYPGHGSASYYWFTEDGTLVGAGLMNTGHRCKVIDAAIDNEVGARSGMTSELQIILKMNERDFEIATFVLGEERLRLLHLTDTHGEEINNDGRSVGVSLVH
jgi:hypothetical protein